MSGTTTQSGNGFPTELNWENTDLTVKDLTATNITTDNIDATTINNVPRFNIIEGDNVTFKWNASNYIGESTVTDPVYGIDYQAVLNRDITPGDSTIVTYSSTFRLQVSSYLTACLILKNDDGSFEVLGTTADIEPLARMSLECLGRLSCIRITWLGDRGFVVPEVGADPSYLIEKVMAGDITRVNP